MLKPNHNIEHKLVMSVLMSHEKPSKTIVSLFLFLLLVTTISTATVHHEIVSTISPKDSSLQVIDKITFSGATTDIDFSLHHGLQVYNNNAIKLVKENVTAVDVGMDKDDAGSESVLKLNKYKISVPKNHKGEFKITIKYQGLIESPVIQSEENYARGFSESSGIIWEKGVYLAGSSYWLPYFSDELITYKLTTTLPKDWRVVTVGKRSVDETTGNFHKDSWTSMTPQEEVFLIAADFTEYSFSMGSVDAMAFLRTPDEALANKYLETTAQYMEMYRKLIGPYPYTKFALVENFWETGYGMPSFTLLGEKIIRFPFILHSSYPHELLHNWWGNSVYIDFEGGNWCEGLTAYMADHLIQEQRNQGEKYRRSTLQKFTNFVNPSNDFPLNKFSSRTDAASEAIGYGKTLMFNHMLRRKVGDENFIKSYQLFNRDNKFKRASFDDIRQAFEQVTEQDLKWFFDQWILKTAAPSLLLSDVAQKNIRGANNIAFTLTQIQTADVFYLDVPLVLITETGNQYMTVEMNEKQQEFLLPVANDVQKIMIDPHFDLFRILDPKESPPTFTRGYGADKTIVVLPDEKDAQYSLYQQFAENWVTGKQEKFEIMSQDELKAIPENKSVMILGLNNDFINQFNNELSQHQSKLSEKTVTFGKQQLPTKNNSFFVTVANPLSPKQTLTLLSLGNNGAMAGMVRKLPHYGKYSYLAFSGDEPTNIAKGQWDVNQSPLIHTITDSKDGQVELEKRAALATLTPAFSAKRMMETIDFLASDNLKGRGLDTQELDQAADYIADKFNQYGLLPASDDGSYLQKWQQDVLDKKGVKFTNVIGMIKGTNPDITDAVVLSAHYDHLGTGWPNTKTPDNTGKIHNGADDNASGVSVMLEIAKSLGKSSKPARTIIFVAFTAEEAGLLGSQYFVENYKKFSAQNMMANLNLDTVGRLYDNKLMVLNSNTAREWKFIFMGTDYTTGVATQMVTQDLDASDQVSFINQGIPAVQLFYAGIKSDYHVPQDTSDKIDSAGLVKVAAIVREVIEYLAERTDPMPFTGKVVKNTGQTQVATRPKSNKRAATGSMPDFAFSGVGVKIAGISEGSAADTAGLLKDDVIIKFDADEINNLKEYSNQLKQHKPNDTVVLTVLRGDEQLQIKITLGER